MNTSTSDIQYKLVLSLCLIGFGLVVLGVRLEILGAYADSIPYWDGYEIGELLYKYQTGVLGIADIFRDANEHRLVFNRLFSILFFEGNQNQWDQQIPMVFNSVLWAVSGIVLLRVIVNNLPLSLALLPASLVLIYWLLPIALVNIVWGVQVHTYTMILFSVLGCWMITNQAFSNSWWGGVVFLMMAPLTLAGGTFAGLSVAGVALFFALADRFRSTAYNSMLLAGMAAGVFGLVLILIQGERSISPALSLAEGLTTLLRTMSWPLISQVWPALIYAIPVIILIVQSLRVPKPSRLSLFTITIFGFLFLVALATAYARGEGGAAPARRYFDYLTLIPIMSVLALVQIRWAQRLPYRILLGLLIVGVFFVQFAAIPAQVNAYQFTAYEQNLKKGNHKRNLVSYLNTKDPVWLRRGDYRINPYPHHLILRDMVERFNDVDMLPYTLQTPKPLEYDFRWTSQQRQESAFIVNGTIKVTTSEHGVRPYEQDVFGSYKPAAGGVKATGTFESTEFHHNRDYIAVPVTGYFGYPGMNIKFVDVGSGEEFKLPIDVASSQNAEKWVYALAKLPKGYYKLIAEDRSQLLWFGFATPKSVGRWSYSTQSLIAHSYYVWIIGIFLILLGLSLPLSRKHFEQDRNSG